MASTRTFRNVLALIVAFGLLVAAVWLVAGNQARAASATPVVYVATGENFPDALGAGPVAAMVKGPVLLVRFDSIPGQTAAELTRLAPDKIVIVGGTGVVSTNVENGLTAFAGTVERIGGTDRYDTAAKLSAATYPASFDADTLDGKDSSLLVPRAAFASSGNLPNGTGAFTQTLLSTDITAPARGVLLINATVDAFAGPDPVFFCLIEVNGSTVTGSAMHAELDNAGNSEEDCTTVAGLNVDAGTHTVTLRTNAGVSVSLEDGMLTVLWVPFDGTGNTPTSITPLGSTDDIEQER